MAIPPVSWDGKCQSQSLRYHWTDTNLSRFKLGHCGVDGRGRDEDFSSPPAQIPACAANAPGSSLGSDVGGTHGVKPQCAPAHSRQSDRRGQLGSVSEPRPPVGCSPRVRPFPPRLPPEVAFLCSVASSVLRPHPTSHPRTCSACGFCLPEPARHTSGHG